MNVMLTERSFQQDWDSLTPETQIQGIRDTSQYKWFELPKRIAEWNARFPDMPYLKFRKLLSEITARNLRATELRLLRKDFNKNSLHKDTYLIPVDDDDYLSPDIYQHLNVLRNKGKVIIDWPCYVVYPVKHVGSKSSLLWHDFVSYATTSRRQHIIDWHPGAKALAAKEPHERIDQPLGIYNKHPAGWWQLEHMKEWPERFEMHEFPHMPYSLKWAVPYLEELWALCSRLCT